MEEKQAVLISWQKSSLWHIGRRASDGKFLQSLTGTSFLCSCPTCGGAGFVRKTGGKLNANAARKDQQEIVCQTCKGLGKVGKSSNTLPFVLDGAQQTSLHSAKRTS